MESSAVKKRGRPRKRRREDEDKNGDGKSGVESKKRVADSTPIVLVGRYMLKKFDRNGVFLGKVVYYSDGLYRVNYEDGDFEDLESREIRSQLLESEDFNRDLNARRRKLDELVLKNSAKSKKQSEVVEPSASVELGPSEPATENDEAKVNSDDDSLSDSSENPGDGDLGFEDNRPAVLPPELPPSSGTIGVPEQYVSHLLSVYGFLRSFSVPLFLNPFTLEDFVGTLNFCAPSTLLDAIHVAVMRALRRHLETLSAEGSELASKCIRCIDWSLLDTLTWPVYVVQYLTIMGYTKGPEWKGFYDEVLGREYYSLPAGRKLIVLQVLCDDVFDSAELRAEMDSREALEVGMDCDEEAINPSENGPRRVHPRYSKTSACKDMGIIGENSHDNLNFLSSKGVIGDINSADMDVDKNSDDCRLCGMDGTLLCCDGCPSAYHTRCIGVMKLSIPEGSWYCPECTIRKIGPAITTRTSLKGAETFGVDLYGQIFLGTCNHLLVIRAPVNEEPCIRYYSRKDIPKVMQVLCSFLQHGDLYLGICLEIAKYWDMPRNIIALLEISIREINSARLNEDAHFSLQPLPPALEGNLSNAACVNESSVIGAVQADLPGSQINSDTNIRECPVVNMKQKEGNGPTGSISQYTDTSNLTNQSLIERPSAVGNSCPTGNSNCNYDGLANGTQFLTTLSSLRKEVSHIALGKCENGSSNDCVYMGSTYKPQSYLNHYMHGDFAASAAAKLASLSSEETRPSETHGSDSSKKVQSEIFLQTKAFSLVASRFFWPTSEKKLVEVPRERCGWCLSCKASVSSKRGCMLNHSLLSVTKIAMKMISSIRPIKSGEGSIASIGAYILYMEESLCGLILGPFTKASYRKQWRKRAEQASTCSDIKYLLLELEENIRTIALSSDWVKLADDWLAEYSATQNAICTPGTTQKRAPGRRGKKQSSVPELTDDSSQEKGFVWWQGGQQSKLVFQKAILPRSMVRIAARQGGSKKISGISYTDGSDIPKRSKRLAWRAAVEMTKNASQLALQVRNLDLHIRWSDIVHPEQNYLDGKSAETEASAFRNALICSKNVVENKVSYGVAFGSQKHLPSRIMKSIVETEQTEDGQVKFWFLENKVPLYLIKSYERNAIQMLPSTQEPFNFPRLQKKRLKAPHRDVFFYLRCKRDNIPIPSCISCQLDVQRAGATCGVCKGYCHTECSISSSVSKNEDVEFLIMCKPCYSKKVLAQAVTRNESPTSPLHLQVPVYQKMIIATKVAKSNRKSQDTRSEIKQVASESRSVGKKPKPCSWGIMWKKKSGVDASASDSSIDFRLKNILLKGGLGLHRKAPMCHLCRQPYKSDQMYIHCETCQNWFHAEAVELDESRIFDVAGFKCCRCRRIKIPKCPFTPKEETKIRRIIIKPPKRENYRAESDLGTIPVHSNHSEIATSVSKSKETCNTPLKQDGSEFDSDSGTGLGSKQSEPSTPMFPFEVVSQQEADPLLFSMSSAELIMEPDSEMDSEWDAGRPGPQKLQVRRHGKREGDSDGFLDNSYSDFEYYTHITMENSANMEWDDSTVQNTETGGMLFDEEVLDFENSDYEPQTLFTFSELLGVDGSVNELEDQARTFGMVSEDNEPEQYGVTVSNDESNPLEAVKPSVNCSFCFEPEPNISCGNCDRWIHSHCLPQTEQLSGDCNWKCDQCREWC